MFRHDRVKRWTRKVNIFEKDFVVVPINENYHWYLCIICYPGKVKSGIEYICQARVLVITLFSKVSFLERKEQN